MRRDSRGSKSDDDGKTRKTFADGEAGQQASSGRERQQPQSRAEVNRDNPWSRILAVLETKINRNSFETWLRPTRYDYQAAASGACIALFSSSADSRALRLSSARLAGMARSERANWKHGFRSQKAKEEAKSLREFLQECKHHCEALRSSE